VVIFYTRGEGVTRKNCCFEGGGAGEEGDALNPVGGCGGDDRKKWK